MNPYRKIKDFHATRASGVGSSDIPTLAGLNRRWGQTPLTLYREKRGEAPAFEGNDRTHWGNKLQAQVLHEFIERRYDSEAADDFLSGSLRGRSVGPFKVETEAWHPEYRFAMAHADLVVDDGYITRPQTWEEAQHSAMKEAAETGKLPDITVLTGGPYLVEAKTSGLHSAKRREGEIFEGYDPDDRSQFGIPDKVFMQVQWQLFCYGLQEAWVAVLIDTADYREYGPIIYDPRHVEQSLALAIKFWDMVESGTEPTPTTWADVVSVYPELTNTTAMVSGEQETEARRMIARGNALKAQVKSIADELDDVKMALGILAGDEVQEDGKVKRTMNRLLNDSEGKKLASFSEQTRDTLTLGDYLDSVAKKEKAKAALQKKADAGKPTKDEDWRATDLTEAEAEAVKLEERLRALGCYKTSAPFRVVNY